ncbi:hypothetical protein CYMTET_23604 [Cymbomonas tetramitiformis]|uniref:Uncharacterized protein n=1 Tax=Cymbomonas tetramitiformis TaxID=36881 RepID=A0AAE0FXL6_9CHLO|nr:hypothetical protein CYMTET_23604 [Cymbomonas tetramitiformis]
MVYVPFAPASEPPLSPFITHITALLVRNMSVRELSLGGNDQYFEAGKDSEKLSKIVVVLTNEFSSAGLELSSFDLDDLTKAAIPRVNELLYDTLAYIVRTDSAAEHFLLGTDSVWGI